MMYGGASGGSSGRAKMKVVVIDQDRSEMSQRFVDDLKENDSLQIEVISTEKIEEFASQEKLDLLEAEERMARDSIRLSRRVGMVVVPKGFGENAGIFWQDPPKLKIGVDPSRNAEAAMMEGFIMESMGQLFSSRMQDPTSFRPTIQQARDDVSGNDDLDVSQKLLLTGFFGAVETMIDSVDQLQQTDDEEAAAQLGGGGGLQLADIERIDVLKKVDPNSQSGQLKKLQSKWDISFPQGMIWGVLGCVAGFSISIARERSQGTIIRLQVAPLSKFQILLGKALACFLSVIAVIVVMTILGYLLGMRPVSYSKLALASVCMATCFVGIMMTLSVLGKTEQSVSGVGWAINMIMAMLGGAMMPVMFMPQFLKTISVISPIRWAIQVIEGAVWRDFSWGQMAFPCTLLVTVGLVGLALGTTILSRRST